MYDEVEHYYAIMRGVQDQYERALSPIRSLLSGVMMTSVPTISVSDGVISHTYSEGTQAAIDSAKQNLDYIHDAFRAPMQKAAEDYQRAIDRRDGRYTSHPTHPRHKLTGIV